MPLPIPHSLVTLKWLHRRISENDRFIHLVVYRRSLIIVTHIDPNIINIDCMIHLLEILLLLLHFFHLFLDDVVLSSHASQDQLPLSLI